MTTAAPTRRHQMAAMRRLLGAAVALILLAPAVSAHADDDPNLDQSIGTDQQVVAGEQVLDDGHVDMGPKFVDGQWTLLIHDDAAKADAGATSVWRHPEQTVMHVLDDAALTVPDDPAYAFVGAAAGATVWVVPQTQRAGVVWLGWNTQDPDVMAAIDRGVTLSMDGVEGPGIVTTYLQSGAFGEPQILWDSRVADPQPVWVDVNTHTHANWVFTEPGIYLLRITVAADLVDGSVVSDTQDIRFAIGSATDPQAALAATWSQDEPDGTAEAGAEPAEAASSAQPGADSASETGHGETGDPFWTGPVVAGAIGLGLVVIAAACIAAIIRSNRARRRVLGARDGGTVPGPGDEGGEQR